MLLWLFLHRLYGVVQQVAQNAAQVYIFYVVKLGGRNYNLCLDMLFPCAGQLAVENGVEQKVFRVYKQPGCFKLCAAGAAHLYGSVGFSVCHQLPNQQQLVFHIVPQGRHFFQTFS